MDEKKKIGNAKLLIIAIVLILVIIGTTYAWLRLSKESEVINKIKVGDLELVLDDSISEGIMLEKAVPMSDSKGQLGTEYTFTVENKGKTSLDYNLYLKDVVLDEEDKRLEDVNVRYKLVRDNTLLTKDGTISKITFVNANYTFYFDETLHRIIKVVDSSDVEVTGLADAINNKLESDAVFDDALNAIKGMFGENNSYKIEKARESKLISSMNIDQDSNRVLDTMTINQNQKYTYKLQVWIDKDAGTEIMGKIFFAKIGINATQHKTTNVGSFATDSWDTISKAVKSGVYSYQVGDVKEVNMGEFGKHKVRVVNTSECTNGELSQTACGFVVEFTDIITMHNINQSLTNVGGWPASSMSEYLNDTILKSLPSDLQQVISETTVVSSHGSTAGEENFTSTDKLYLLSTKELWNGGTGYDSAENTTRQLDYYKKIGVALTNYFGAIKKSGTEAQEWWLRSSNSNSPYIFLHVTTAGSYGNELPTKACGISPAFRI